MGFCYKLLSKSFWTRSKSKSVHSIKAELKLHVSFSTFPLGVTTTAFIFFSIVTPFFSGRVYFRYSGWLIPPDKLPPCWTDAAAQIVRLMKGAEREAASGESHQNEGIPIRRKRATSRPHNAYTAHLCPITFSLSFPAPSPSFFPSSFFFFFRATPSWAWKVSFHVKWREDRHFLSVLLNLFD